MSDFYSEKDLKRINAALTALRSVELRSDSLNEVISVLSGENNTVNTAVDDHDFFDKSTVYQCLSNLIRELDHVGGLQEDMIHRLGEVEELAKDAYDLASHAHDDDVSFPEAGEPDLVAKMNNMQRQIDFLYLWRAAEIERRRDDSHS